MKNELTCEVVQDLLPSYVDHLTSDVTNTAIVSHVKTAMIAGEFLLPCRHRNHFLKKIRRTHPP